MRCRSRGRRRSVDRGRCGPGIQPRKYDPPGRRRRKERRKTALCVPILRGAHESRVLPERKMPWDASGSLRTYADDERAWEVGQTCSTCEVLEQGRAIGGGGDGGKRFDQGKSA